MVRTRIERRIFEIEIKQCKRLTLNTTAALPLLQPYDKGESVSYRNEFAFNLFGKPKVNYPNKLKVLNGGFVFIIALEI